MVTAFGISIGVPGSRAGDASSSMSMASFCGPVNITTGAQPITIAIGIGSRRLPILEPMQIAAGAGRLARHHAHHQPVGAFSAAR